jgi:cytidyltransferase-like protein
MIIICTSGYFDNIHCGHVESFKQAKEHGDYLIVFVDSDRKAIIKKGFVMMPENERAELIRNIKCVDEVVVVDTSIAEALEKYKPNVFFKGGDRNVNNLPQEELDICSKLNIKIVCSGNKIQASSQLLDKLSVIKPWGKYTIINQGNGYVVKKITVNPDSQLSLQFHLYRNEFWTINKGVAVVDIGNRVYEMKKDEQVYIPMKCVHRLSNDGDEILEVLEIQTGLCNEDDIVRLKDDYNRI